MELVSSVYLLLVFLLWKLLFSKDEIKAAVFSLGGNRSSGLDGFPIAFFQHLWTLLEDEFQIFFNEFHEKVSSQRSWVLRLYL